ncbi:MAG: hypothetical protein AABX31_03145 [Nanoarchaeota archaeon]
MITYTVFIRDEVKDFHSATAVERHVVVRGSAPFEVSAYFNPNEKEDFNEKGPFTSKNSMNYNLDRIAYEIVQSQLNSKAGDLELRVEYKTTRDMLTKEGKKFIEYGLNEDQQRQLNTKITQKYEVAKQERSAATKKTKSKRRSTNLISDNRE